MHARRLLVHNPILPMRLLALVVACAASCAAYAQSVDVGYELMHDRIDYHFDNQSTWDTQFLVPHFFEQRYSADTRLVIIRAGTPNWIVEAGVSGVRRGDGSDYDTFFQPGGDVVVHGHATAVDTRSWRLAATARVNQWWNVRASYWRDQFRHPPSFSTTTHTMPPSSATSFSDSRESAASDVVELAAGVSRSAQIARRLRLRASIDFAPLTVARLTTYLPDQHPGEAIRFAALAYSLTGLIDAELQIGRAALIVGGKVGHAGHYISRSAFSRDQNGGHVLLSWGAK